jgi:nucleoside-diphosphate-sugar epimerase
MEQTLRQSGVQTILLRAGDFLDTEPSGNWFDHVIVKPLHRQHIAYPGPLDTPHSWAYLPDLARAAEQLARRRADLPTFSEVLFPGYTLSGREIAEIMSFALGARITAGQMPWLPLRIARPFWPMARHLFEMRYLWNRPHSVSRETFDNVLSDFRETPVDIALLRAAEHKIRPNHPMPRSKVHLGGASQGPVHS